STIVSTPMLPKLTAHYGVDCKIGLTGFKWIAKMIEEFPEMDFIGGGEESFGFMVGDFVRDKDAVTSTLLACEIAALSKASGSSFFKELIDLYCTHGFYKEKLISITKKGKSGAVEIQKIMHDARTTPPTQINGSTVICIDDYQASISHNTVKEESLEIKTPKANVLIFTTEDGSKIALRPSGTEPKIKYYISVNTEIKKTSDYLNINQQLDVKIEGILKALELK
ncbi:MAG: phospho-sugar mutase, partial [Bacteroidota bacterium]|nr:phospho-sugar mutase [Bacteroidota bacterium]